MGPAAAGAGPAAAAGLPHSGAAAKLGLCCAARPSAAAADLRLKPPSRPPERAPAAALETAPEAANEGAAGVPSRWEPRWAAAPGCFSWPGAALVVPGAAALAGAAAGEGEGGGEVSHARPQLTKDDTQQSQQPTYKLRSQCCRICAGHEEPVTHQGRVHGATTLTMLPGGITANLRRLAVLEVAGDKLEVPKARHQQLAARHGARRRKPGGGVGDALPYGPLPDRSRSSLDSPEL